MALLLAEFLNEGDGFRFPPLVFVTRGGVLVDARLGRLGISINLVRRVEKQERDHFVDNILITAGRGKKNLNPQKKKM